MSIPALGGGANPALQRALMDAAERALADDLQLLSGTGAGPDGASTSATRTRAGRRPTSGPPAAEAILVELTEADQPADLTMAEGWITTPRRPASATPGGVPAQQSGRADAAARPPQAPAPATAQPGAARAGESGALPLARLVAMLKQTGIDFRDAMQVLREIRPGEPLPPRAELKALWAATPGDAATPNSSTANSPASNSSARANTQLDLPVDHLVRERAWHRAAEAASAVENTEHATDRQASGPTLATIAQPTPPNQAYVAGLSTAEFQRLITVLGAAGGTPAWFWQLRNHGGLRGLVERPAIARLNTTRFAGTRLSAWLFSLLGMILLWYVGIHAQIWW